MRTLRLRSVRILEARRRFGMNNMSTASPGRNIGRYVLVVLGIAGLTGTLLPLRENVHSTTVGSAFLLVVLSVAIFRGSRPALLASDPGV